MRPRRQIRWDPGYGWRVTPDEGFTSRDEVLARKVAAELDEVDPLPCPHSSGTHELEAWGVCVIARLCDDCGATIPEGDT